ncbi:protein FAM200C-like [Palaemon carinicauda]|uniref:protein FAM200C-like n=1 Tax=Palaemon carinicauda TaxID=392227 RepID=UPI0035B65597
MTNISKEDNLNARSVAPHKEVQSLANAGENYLIYHIDHWTRSSYHSYVLFPDGCNKHYLPDLQKGLMAARHGGTDAGHDLNSLKIKRERFDHSGTLSKLGFVPVEKPLLQASYEVALLCAKKKKTHTIAEELVKPCALEMAKIVLGTEAEKKLKQIPLSNDIIHARIHDMSQDVLHQVITDLKASPVGVSIQLDESTDVSFCSQLMAFVRYVKEKEVVEEFLFCKPQKTTAKATDVFSLVKEFFLEHEMTLNMCGSICTDGAPVMLGNKPGFATLVKKEVTHVTITHCVLHRHALATKTLPEKLKTVLSVVHAVNFIRGRAVNHRLFASFCEEIGAEHSVLLYLTEVMWLSRGRVLTRVFELHEEIMQFLGNQGSEIADHFENREFILSLAYLADVFMHLNELNVYTRNSNDYDNCQRKVICPHQETSNVDKAH